MPGEPTPAGPFLTLPQPAGGSSTSSGSTGDRVATSPGVCGTGHGARIDGERNTRFAFADMEISTVGQVDQQSSEQWVVRGVKGTLIAQLWNKIIG